MTTTSREAFHASLNSIIQLSRLFFNLYNHHFQNVLLDQDQPRLISLSPKMEDNVHEIISPILSNF